jgi:wobble nucleotide-excising tRNase
MNKEYFMNRLANGENMDAIGAEVAAMMNAAMAEHNARIEAEKVKVAEAEKEQAKRELIEELIEIVQELAILEGMEPDEIQVTEEDINQMVAALNEMFGAMRELKKVIADMEAHMPAAVPAHVTVKPGKITPSDEQILADFIKMFN